MLISIYENVFFFWFFLINFSILCVNCRHVCIIYANIYAKISSGGLEVSLSIYILNVYRSAFLNYDVYLPVRIVITVPKYEL